MKIKKTITSKKQAQKTKKIDIEISYKVNTKPLKEALALMKQLESVSKRVKAYFK